MMSAVSSLSSPLPPGIEWGNLEDYEYKSAERLEEEAFQAELARPPATAEEIVLYDYTPLPVASVEGLCAEFPVVAVEDAGGIGLKRVHLYWDVERLESFKNSKPTNYEHYTNFEFWTLTRLRATMAFNKGVFDVSEKEGALCTLTVKENLLPLQMLMKGPFVWDQEGAVLGVKAHSKKIEFLCGARAGPKYDEYVRAVSARMMERLRGCEVCEVVEVAAGSKHLFQVVIEGVVVKATAATATATTATPKAAVATVVSPLAATVAPTATAAPKVPAGPSAFNVLKNDGRVVWKRYSDAECRSKDERGYFHAIEVKNNARYAARAIDTELFAALKGCSDCKVSAPPAGSPYLFVVQMLPPRR